MKALADKEWEFIGCVQSGLVFRNIMFEDYVITREAIFLRNDLPNVYLKWTPEGVIFEHDRQQITSPSKFQQLQLEEIFQASKDVVSL